MPSSLAQGHGMYTGEYVHVRVVDGSVLGLDVVVLTASTFDALHEAVGMLTPLPSLFSPSYLLIYFLFCNSYDYYLIPFLFFSFFFFFFLITYNSKRWS